MKQLLAHTRPRVSGEREQQILDRALDVLAESGYDKLTLDTVAARAHASKATLYRRWTSKADLVIDALCSIDSLPVDLPDTGDLRSDLVAMAVGKPAPVLDPVRMELFCGLATALHRDLELKTALLERFIRPRQQTLRRVFERARDRGEIAPDVDLDLVGEVLPAMVLFRLSFTQTNRTPEELIIAVLDKIVLPAVRHRSG